MIKQYKLDNEKDIVLNYIGNCYYKCLYLYLDLLEFSLEDNSVSCWGMYNENEELTLVMLNYHSALHVYSEKLDYNREELVSFIAKLDISIICSREEIIKDLAYYFPSFTPEIGVVSQLYEMAEYEDSEVVRATVDDLKEVAELIYLDEDSGASYDLSDLVSQMSERLNKNFSRAYVVKKNNQIVANVSTGGEAGNIATLTNVIVRKEYRRQGLAGRVYRKLCWELLCEGKEVYSIYYVPESIALHNKMGFIVRCGYGKLFRKTH